MQLMACKSIAIAVIRPLGCLWGEGDVGSVDWLNAYVCSHVRGDLWKENVFILIVNY